MQIRHPLIVSLLSLLVVVAQLSCVSKPAKQSNAASAVSDQSVVDEVLQRYEQAIGGKEAIERVKSYKMKGRFALSGMPQSGNLEVWGKQPHKTLMVIEFPFFGTLRKGFDGENRWVQTPAGTFTANSSPQEIAELERDAEVYSAGHIKSLFDSMKLEQKVRINGREIYMIEGKPARGPAEKLFFDVENGLLVRWDMARRQPQRGTVFVKVHLDDYRDVDGVKVPFNVRFVFESFDFLVKIDELQHNVAIEDAVFRKP